MFSLSSALNVFWGVSRREGSDSPSVYDHISHAFLLLIAFCFAAYIIAHCQDLPTQPGCLRVSNPPTPAVCATPETTFFQTVSPSGSQKEDR
jgi:hypothetical protein